MGEGAYFLYKYETSRNNTILLVCACTKSAQRRQTSLTSLGIYSIRYQSLQIIGIDCRMCLTVRSGYGISCDIFCRKCSLISVFGYPNYSYKKYLASGGSKSLNVGLSGCPRVKYYDQNSTVCNGNMWFERSMLSTCSVSTFRVCFVVSGELVTA